LALSNYCERLYSSKFDYVTYHRIVDHTTFWHIAKDSILANSITSLITGCWSHHYGVFKKTLFWSHHFGVFDLANSIKCYRIVDHTTLAQIPLRHYRRLLITPHRGYTKLKITLTVVVVVVLITPHLITPHGSLSYHHGRTFWVVAEHTIYYSSSLVCQVSEHEGRIVGTLCQVSVHKKRYKINFASGE